MTVPIVNLKFNILILAILLFMVGLLFYTKIMKGEIYMADIILFKRIEDSSGLSITTVNKSNDEIYSFMNTYATYIRAKPNEMYFIVDEKIVKTKLKEVTSAILNLDIDRFKKLDIIQLFNQTS